jgi:DNA-binding transcriptional ArsR family regulator
MRLLEYLVPSRARREVLKALRSKKGGLTAQQIARETGVAYSSVHRELEQLRELRLAKSVRVGNAVLCSWDGTNPVAKALDPLLHGFDEQRLSVPDDDVVFWNLKKLGAPLARKGAQGDELSPESTLAYALKLARRHPDVARVWPVVFAKQQSRLNLETLAHLSGRLGEKRTLGFFLALTGRLLKTPKLAESGSVLRDGRFRKTQSFFLSEEGEREKRLAELRTPEVAREWHFRMNMPMESFESTFGKFVK